MDKEPLFSLLIVDDEQDIRSSLRRYFRRFPYRILLAEDGEQALDHLSREQVDLMLLDLKMPGKNGLTVLAEARERHPDLDVIMLTAHGGVREAVAAIQGGALDFFEKSTSLDMLSKKITQVHELWLLRRENLSLREELREKFSFDELIGESPMMIRLKDLIARVGPTDTSVLIQGESGTGKELVAKALHHHSPRRDAAFIPVDCAAINESVMESELFGHTKGAFTGADQATLGLIRSADKGTLFMDEVGELPLVMQAKLLRTIQERTVRPVGSTAMKTVDIRIVAASNRNLIEEIARGRFRQDLYYRLSAVTLHVPALRERKEDIPLLARHLVEKLGKQEGHAPRMITDAAVGRLVGRDWPGNVRELENVVRCAMAFAKNYTLSPEDLGPSVVQEPGPTPAGPASLAHYEKEAICNALEVTAGNRRKAARLLGMSEATLYRRIKRYEL
jgi:DNA-binding NtrC family response regulator